MEVRISKERVALSEIDLNVGQIAGLPRNPRQWTTAEMVKLCRSLKETPELLEMRCPIVTPYEGKYVVLGGNMRVWALRENKAAETDVFVIEGASVEKMKEIVIKDNGSFGEWDYDQLANEGDDLDLGAFGVEVPKISETEKLSDLDYDPLYYEPEKRPRFDLKDCIDLTKFEEKMQAVREYGLTDSQMEVVKLLAYRFIKIDFQRVADYYRWWATDGEKRAIERLRCVLVDSGGVEGFLEDNLLRLLAVTDIEDESDD